MTADNSPDFDPVTRIAEAMHSFLKLESAGGIILVIMMVLALLVMNSPLGYWYELTFNAHAIIGIGSLVIDKPLILWINDGLMAVFFLLVALEIKREMLEGELSSREQVMLPAFAALGGMAVPALIYIYFAVGDGAAMRGWAIPTATDIAFSLGVLSVLGRRVPLSLRIFLTALAIIDDLGAIIIIALFYSGQVSLIALALGAAALVVLVVMNRMGVVKVTPYLLVGVVLWVCVLKSGIHATVAGVLLGLTIPLRGASAGAHSPLRRLEHSLHPWVVFAVLPIFAFANSGISFDGMQSSAFVDPVFLGIAAGLFIGKQAGVFGMSYLAVRLGLGVLPDGANWKQMYGVAALTGIGFTMSLFIGGLAFPDGNAQIETKLGVIFGSVASALLGWVMLASCGRTGKTSGPR